MPKATSRRTVQTTLKPSTLSTGSKSGSQTTQALQDVGEDDADKSKPINASSKPEKNPLSNSTSTSQAKPKRKAKDPKKSHLYTDDNPSTTLHGTGFKDASVARHTLQLVSARSLTYQFQTINTMYWRAKHHPASRSSVGMQDAMEVFRAWLDRYPDMKAQRKVFKLLKRETVERYLDRIMKVVNDNEEDELCVKFARMYVNLPKGKRLANVLLDDSRPEGPDWEVQREQALSRLVDEKKGGVDEEDEEDGLWDGNMPSNWHLRCIGWAWSPGSEKRL